MTPGSRAVYSCSYAFAHSLRGIMNSSMKRRSQVIGLFVLALLTAVPVLAQNAPQPGGETPLLPAGVPPLPFEITQHEPIDTQDDGFSSAIPIACGAGDLAPSAPRTTLIIGNLFSRLKNPLWPASLLWKAAHNWTPR